jgi:hypothetical protein
MTWNIAGAGFGGCKTPSLDEGPGCLSAVHPVWACRLDAVSACPIHVTGTTTEAGVEDPPDRRLTLQGPTA